MLLETLRREICAANRGMLHHPSMIAPGSVSGINRELGFIAITPGAIPRTELEPAQIVVLDLGGRVVEGSLPPSSDAATHLVLYSVFKEIGGVTHMHSRYATMFAQAGRPIPCLGTTHAALFHGEIPVTRPLRKPEIEGHYAHNTGLVILERFSRLNASEIPAVLVVHHGSFTWGASAGEAVANGLALEEVASLAFGTLQLNPSQTSIPSILHDRHFTDSKDIRT